MITIERIYRMKKYRPLIVAVILTILAFITGYYSNRNPENVAHSYLVSQYVKENPPYSCKQIQFDVITEDDQTYEAEYTCSLVTKTHIQRTANGTIKLKKVNHKWRVVNTP
jgi:hypothetical protein